MDNKKHISFVGKNTHPFGTLKQMDSIAASNMKHSEKKSGSVKNNAVIVSTDIAETITLLNSILPGTVTAISQSVYLFESTNFEATVLSASSVQLSPGTYPILATAPIAGAKVVMIREKEYYAIDNGYLKLLLQK